MNYFISTFLHFCSFYSLSILLYHKIYPLGLTITRIPNKSFIISHIPLSINSVHSHLNLSSFDLRLLLQTLASNLHLHFQRLLLQTLASNLHLHFQVLCHSICLVLLVIDIRLNALTFMFLIMHMGH